MLLTSLLTLCLAAQPPHTFAVSGDQLLLDGHPFHMRCGEMHYARVPRAYWRDRFRKMKAMGLNTVCTYSFWNVHEPEKGKFVFSDNADVHEYVKEAAEEGLYVLLRPGPYSCAEWEWGGFPYWLANYPGIQVRTHDPRYLKEARNYLLHLGAQLKDEQITHGGPILMVQVENEYGSFGHDMIYKKAVQKDLRDAGFDTTLYTADGPSDSMLAGGTLPDVMPAVNFGGDPKGAFAELEKFRSGTPKICTEFYPGWFDSWRKPHAHTSTQDLANDIEYMESHNEGYSLYVVHGGTSFGFMNGANWYDKGYWPQTTSYDYSTTIDEAGRPTDKYWAFRKVVQAHLTPGEILPPVPDPLPSTKIDPFPMVPMGSVFDNLPKPIHAKDAPRFERLNQAYGFVLYRKILTSPITDGLVFDDMQDRAQVYCAGAWVGTVMRGEGPVPLKFSAPAGTRLDILVENMGRVNYGGHLLTEHKGLGPVHSGGALVQDWDVYKLPFDTVPTDKAPAHTLMRQVPALFHGSFTVASPADTFIDMRKWGKGVVWVNGHNLGRFWHVGPQQSLFLPAPWMKAGVNDVVVLDLEPVAARQRTLSGVVDPIFELEPGQ